ncbi:MAG: DUF262 domain-containing protein, partial [Flavobacteriales bacterium]
QYQSYYLGPVVFSANTEDGSKSIIDGQQRITSITLILIFLFHLQKNQDDSVQIKDLIFSEKYGKKSFNMMDPDREDCLQSLFDKGEYIIKEDDNETVINIANRYEDIESSFPDHIRENSLLHFIDWFIENVILVQITAYSDDNAYTIFETMNDRGLSLTSTEMLKGYVLSRIENRRQREEINSIWKRTAQLLDETVGDKSGTHSFFQAWFRGQFSESMRPSAAGSVNMDFERIGTRFHSWFKEKHETLFGIKSGQEFYEFFKQDFPFFANRYIEFTKALKTPNPNLENVYHIGKWGIADSLQEPLLLSALRITDTEEECRKKMNLVAHYIETFTVRRALNFRKFGQSSIKHSMFNVIKSIRHNDLVTLYQDLGREVLDMKESWDGISQFRMHKMNRRFVKHLLCRISGHVDVLAGKDNNYSSFMNPKGKPFEIEHIWSDHFERHRDEFSEKDDFDFYRNKIGSLILLPNGTNQSFSDSPYAEKSAHYLKENTYAQSLHPDCYIRNPNFTRRPELIQLKFEAHPEFKKADVNSRNDLVHRICTQIWDWSPI